MPVSFILIHVASAIILFHALCTLNGMHHRGDAFRHMAKRIAYVLMACGSFGILFAPVLGGFVPLRWPLASLMVGLAVYVIQKQLERHRALKVLEAQHERRC